MLRQVVTLTHRVAALTRHVQVGADKDADAREDGAAAAGAARSDRGAPPSQRREGQSATRAACVCMGRGGSGHCQKGDISVHAGDDRAQVRPVRVCKGRQESRCAKTTGKRVAGARKGPQPLFRCE